MQVLKNRLLVEFEAPPTRSKSGLIIIPDEAKDASYTGKVIAIGPEQWNVRVGERVVFSRYAGVPIKNVVGEPMQAIVDDSEVLAVVVDEEIRYDRETIAITGKQLQQMLYGLGYKDLTSDEEVITYVNYVHASDTLYVTVERQLQEVVVNGK